MTRIGTARIILWNMACAAAVFLPIYMAGIKLSTMLQGFPFAERGLVYEAGGALLLYFGLSIPVAVGVVSYSLVLSVLGTMRNRVARRIAAVALAPLIPLTPLALGVLGGAQFFFADSIYPTAAATLAYGVSASMILERVEASMMG